MQCFAEEVLLEWAFAVDVVLERDVRYLDSRIALLIQNRMALDEVRAYFLVF